MTPETDPVREAVIEARRAQILDAAVKVFAEKGFHRAKIKDVAQTAGIAEGTIYNYFNSKDDLLTAMVIQFSEVNQFVEQAVRLMTEANAEQLLRFVWRNRLEVVKRNQTYIQAILPQVISKAELRSHFFQALAEPTLAAFERVWQAQVDRGEIRAVNPQVLVRVLMGMFFGLLLLDIVGDPVVRDHEEMIGEEVLDLLLYGLLPRSNALPAS